MQQHEIILRAFLRDKLAAQGWDADEATLQHLASVIALEQGNPDESKEIRSIDLKEGTDGKVSAERFSFYNLMRVSYHDLLGFGLKEMTILLTEDTKLKILLSLLTLLHEFYPKLKYSFNEQDANILLAIYELRQKEFSVKEIAEAYLRRFGQSLSENQLTRSFDFFKELEVLRYLGNGKYLLREKMTYER